MFVRRVATGSFRALSTVKATDRVSVHLTAKDPKTSTVIFSTVGSSPVSLVLGQGMVIPGLEKLLPGSKVGSVLKETFPPELAFGFRAEDAENMFKLPRQPGEKPEVGLRVELDNGRIGTVLDVDEEFVYVDCNHTLAGQSVEFEVEVLEIEQEVNNQMSGVNVNTLKEGDGKNFPQPGNKVYVHYVGTLAADGKEFDSSRKRGQPFSFVLGAGQVIKGWDVGVAKLSLGQRAQLFIPSELGYGSTGAGGVIPPDANLVFDVELVQINQTKAQQ
ncbi:hypothetical protein BASA81_010270 [Batrachochytrium salamandrivorans]|nr:hypothetical protein BASA81_010270 [Batrachochytrium salamandrivorans]